MVFPWYGKEGLKSRVPAGWVIIYLLVLSVPLQPVLQSYSELPAGRGGRVWGNCGAFSLQGPIHDMGVFEQPTCMKLAC